MQNRIIKFRAWDGFKMYEPCVWMGKEYIPIRDSFVETHLMQYTGLKDKNGTPIFEGDIMSTGHGWSNYTVVFEDGSFCFGNDQPNGADRLSQDRVGRLEVIGNIYETPTP